MECKKVKFATEKDCNEHIKRLKKTSTREVKPIRGYLCPYCNTWHLTSRETFESIKIKELNITISELKVTINELKVKINLLEGKNNKEINKELKRDERITELVKCIGSKNNTIAKFRKTNSDLINENIQLLKKLEPQSA
jgi:hypothetical protein